LLLVEKGAVAGKIEGLDPFGGMKTTTYKIETLLHKFKLVDDIKLPNPDADKDEGDDDDF
jgi:hypothetical protein